MPSKQMISNAVQKKIFAQKSLKDITKITVKINVLLKKIEADVGLEC